MLKFCVIATLLAVCFAADLGNTNWKLANDPEIINEVNTFGTTWTAGENPRFKNVPLESAKRLLGWKPNPELRLKYQNKVTKVIADLPANFSAAAQWPQCKTIGSIYNQAECGSCWAFGCVEAASDRMCIQSQGKQNYLLSFMDEVCCDGNDDGCNGGDAMSAWEYVSESGLVSDACYPYTIPTCPPAQQPCLNFVDTPSCLSQCNSTTTKTWSPVQFQAPYSIGPNDTAIMTEIYTNGPVEACFEVYEDFLSYKSGVYQYQTGNDLGGHCIKIIGWGVENGTPYWLCNNSWTTYWGANGQFKILRGQNECGIEDDVAAAML